MQDRRNDASFAGVGTQAQMLLTSRLAASEAAARAGFEPDRHGAVATATRTAARNTARLLVLAPEGAPGHKRRRSEHVWDLRRDKIFGTHRGRFSSQSDD